MSLTLKLQLGNDIRRLTVPTLSFSDLVGLVEKLFHDALPKSWVVKYRDNENDLVTITSEVEFQEALSFAKQDLLLKLLVVEREVPIKNNGSKNEGSAEPKYATLLEGVFKNLSEANPFVLQMVENWIDVLTKQQTAVPSPNPHCATTHCNPTATNSNSNNNETEVVHNATCDHCHQRISGIRYKCTTCEDYDLCAKCLELRATVHPEHKFYVIEKPFGGFFGGRCGRMFPRGHQLAVCDACDSRIFGIRYKCQDCPDYDLCSQCIQGKEGIHPNHKFTEIKAGFGRGGCRRRWHQEGSAEPQAQQPAQAPSVKKEEAVATPVSPSPITPQPPATSPSIEVTPATSSSEPVKVQSSPQEVVDSSKVNNNAFTAEDPNAQSKIDVNSSLFADITSVDSKLKQLQDMGFADRDRNIAVLVKNRGNLVNTVKDLLDN